MSCQRIQSMLSAYIDDEVQRSDADQIEQHVTECASCSRELNRLRRTVETLASAAEIEPPAFLLEQIEAATIKRPTITERMRSAFRPIPAYARWSAAATAAIGIVVAFMIAQPAVEVLDHQPVSAPSVATAPPAVDVTIEEQQPVVEQPARPAPVKVRKRYVASEVREAPAEKPEPKAPVVTLSAEPTDETDSAGLSEPVRMAYGPERPETVEVAEPVSRPRVEEQPVTIVRAPVVPTDEVIKQENEALSELRAQISDKNKQKRQIRVEPLDNGKYQVELATFRF